jgi:hypothetical protein
MSAAGSDDDRPRRRAASVFLALAGLCGAACDDGSSLFFESSASSRPDVVRLELDALDRDRVTLRVVIGGPTTTEDLFAFNFGLRVSDAALARYVQGSAVVGPALAPWSCPEGISTFVSPQADGLNVSLARLGCPGEGVKAPEETILALTFHILGDGVFEFALGNTFFGNPPAAFDSSLSLTPIDSVEFDPSPVSVLRL